MRHLLAIEDLDRAEIERVMERADSFAEVGRRDIKKVPTLRGRTVVSLFYESSTRTSASFELAAKRLSADLISLKAAGSSVEKGESLKDTCETLSAYDPAAIVIRHPHAGAAQLVAFGAMGAEVTVCGPPALIPRGIEELGCEVSHSLDRLGEADVVYALRLQRERMAESFVPSVREYAAHFQIDSRRLGPRQLLMHPGPVNRGVELSPEVIDGPASLITAQVESGLVVRMAILYEILTSGEPRAGGGRRDDAEL